MLVGVLAGENPVSGTCPVATVVISGGGAGDQSVESPDLKFVPSLFLIDPAGRVLRSHFGFDKSLLNEIAAQMGCAPVADQFDGAPQNKPGCMSRHLEREDDGDFAPATASRSSLGGDRELGGRTAGAVKWLPIPFERTEYCGCTAGNAVSRAKTSSRKE